MIRWTERSFSFDYPPGMMPVILMRLKGTASRLRDFVKDISSEILIRKNGKAWSIQEHIGHLIDLDVLHDGRVDDFLNKLPVLRAADMQNKKTEEARHNDRSLEDLLKEFELARNHFIKRLSLLSPEQISLHPRLNVPMRVMDMAYFVAEHDDHHMALMNEAVVL